MEWLTENKIPIDDAAEAVFDWLQNNLGWFFDGMAAVMEWLIEAILWILQTPHPLVIVLAFVALTFFIQRNWKTALFVAAGFLFILNQDYWEETTESLTLVLSACVVCMGIGVPIGIAAAHRPRLYKAMRPVLDLMQTLPTFVYLIPAIVFFGIGMVPGLIATVIFVLPAPIRLTHLGISSTPTALLEASEAFGARPSQTLWKIELPYALPQIMAGLNQTIMLSLSMVVIAALVGADGLGVPVVRALNQVNTGLGFESGFIIVVRSDHARPDAARGATMKTALEFHDVCIVFGDTPAKALPLADNGKSRSEIQTETGQILGVHDCSLSVGEGEIVVLMGLSGSGKSTLLRAVNGLNPVVRGHVTINDGTQMTDVTHADAKTLRTLRQKHVAMVFQQFGLLPWRTVRENVGFGLELAGVAPSERNETVERQLELVGLSDWADRKVGELSGGMQQRVGLARAFATDAPILLMDEPFSALDPLIRNHLQDELLESSEAAQTHDHLRQPRPRRGIQTGQSDRDHGGRADRPVRHTARNLLCACLGLCCRFRRQHEPVGRIDRPRRDGAFDPGRPC